MVCDNFLIAITRECVSLAAFDFFSFAHVLMGIIIFLVYSLFYVFQKNPLYSLNESVIFVLIAGILWEIIENTIVFSLGCKFEGRKDSILNSITDIILVLGGGFITRVIAKFTIEKQPDTMKIYYFILVGITLGVFLILFIVFGILTLNILYFSFS